MSLVKLREALRKEKFVFGTRETVRELKMGKVKVVFVSDDCDDGTKESIKYYSKLSKVEVVQLKQKAKEIAQVCKKNFPVSVLSY